MQSAAEIIAALGLQAHPEGGHYRETLRVPRPDHMRGFMTAIYYLLAAGERSHWHRVDAVELWNWYAGAPLRLSVSEDGARVRDHLLHGEIAGGAEPQALVPAQAWQSAESLGAWTLVGCCVAPAFEFSGFTLAPPDWAPADRRGAGEPAPDQER